jgi:hypothetical protein
VCLLNNSDSRNYCSDVASDMGSICHLHSSNCNLHMVPSKRLLPSGIYTGDDYLICGEHDKGNNNFDF